MTKNDFKVKYIIGTYKDDKEYPSMEDLFAIADMWYHLEGGKSFIHEYRGIDDGGETVFTSALIKEKDLPKSTASLISSLVESENIRVFKETKHTTYYIINKR
jgi:hypothetical protein